jgi:hypothetical protein
MGQGQDEPQIRAQRLVDEDEAKHEASQKGCELEKPRPSSSDGELIISLAWFPAGESTGARRRWTDLPEDHVAYGKVIESTIRSLSRDVRRNSRVPPITVDALEGCPAIAVGRWACLSLPVEETGRQNCS